MEKIKALPNQLLHGGDYNPDQWLDCPEILEEDVRLMKEAHINCVSLGIFSWAKLEPEEGVYDFDWLENIINHLYENGIYTILATPSATQPRWMRNKYEEIQQVLSNGHRKQPGLRHNFCASSPVMRAKTRAIDEALSQRFGRNPGVIAWHLSNEYAGGGGDAGDGACYCPLCQENFRTWLQERYHTLERLNHCWWTSFWGYTYSDWNQIQAPAREGESCIHGLNLDWKRFTSDTLLDFAKEESAAVKKYSDRPTVVNLMGCFKPLDYFKWAKEMDLVSLDNYPGWHLQENDADMAVLASINHTLTRSLKKQPYLLMESVTSTVNWMPRNPVKRPGMHELSSLQAIGCGSNSVQYFQWRKGRGGVEKYHGAVIDHKNGGNTRVFRDVTRLGQRLEDISSQVLGTCNQPKVAIVYDWENMWAFENIPAMVNPHEFNDYWLAYYKALWKLGVDVDLVNMDDTLEGYQVVIAPVNYMYRGSYMEHVRRFVSQGGCYITTYWSGEVDENDLCFLGGQPLGDVLGIRTEEMDVSPEFVHNSVCFCDTFSDGKNSIERESEERTYAVKDLCALIHPEQATVLAEYQKDFYAGYPALTCNQYGEGLAYFIAAECEDAFIERLYEKILKEAGCACTFAGTLPEGVTVNERGGLYFLQNYHSNQVTVPITEDYIDIETEKQYVGLIELDTYQCMIVRKK